MSWMSYPEVDGDNIDPIVMAYRAIAALVVIHKLVSFVAFWPRKRVCFDVYYQYSIY